MSEAKIMNWINKLIVGQGLRRSVQGRKSESESQDSRRVEDSESRDQWPKGRGAEGRGQRVPVAKWQRKPKG